MLNMFRLTNRLVYRSPNDLKALNDALRRSGSAASFCSKAPSELDQAAGSSEGGSGGSNAFSVAVGPPEREISLFGPKDLRAPLPGNVGLFPQQQRGEEYNDIRTKRQQRRHRDPKNFNPLDNSDVLTYELQVDRQTRIIDQVMYPQYEDTGLDEEDADGDQNKRHPTDVLECVAHQCPELLSRDFQELFPARSLGKNTTVLTICQRSKTDMSFWSPDMEIEREELMAHFIEIAKTVTRRLNDSGYWADFVDPFSGRPVVGPYTPATFFETDERYRNLGFEIEDLGCCKVTRHHVWGTKAFVGSLFTNAPVNSREMRDVLRMLSSHTDEKEN